MALRWKSVFKRQASSTPPPSMESHTVVENSDESSAIMQEMQELATDFILGSMANSEVKLPSAFTQNSSHAEVRVTPGTSENEAPKNRKRVSLGAIENLLQCPVCLERLRSARMMPCQHTFCVECLEEQLEYPDNDGSTIKCPLCKLTVVESAPRNLPTNLYIENLLRVLRNSGGNLDLLDFAGPVVTFAPFVDQPGSLIQGPLSLVTNTVHEPPVLETRCIKCGTSCSRDNKCKHCKQIFCSVCWVAHMDELKDQLVNITEQLNNTTDRFDRRIQEYKTRVVHLTDYIDRDIEQRINELQQERKERIKRAQESAKKGERLADDLKGKILRAQDEISDHRNFKFDTLADNHEKVKTFLSIHKRASDLMAAVALWEPELSDSMDDRGEKERLNFASSEEAAWIYYRSKTFAPKIVSGRDVVQRPSGIAMDSWKNHLLIACPGTRQILVLDKKYRLHRRIQHPNMMSPQGVAFVEDFEEIFVTDKWKHCIHVFNRKGDLLRQICSKGQGEGQLRSPEGIATHPNRNLIYVADTGNDRIQILTSDGTTYAIIGPTGKSETTVTKTGVTVVSCPTHFNQPTAVAVSESVVVVADCGNHKVKVFDHDGNFLRSIGTPGSQKGLLRSPETVTIDLKGNIIVGDSGNGRIQIFSSNGELLRILGSKGTRAGQFGWVSGILIKNNLEIVVSDGKNYTVQVF